MANDDTDGDMCGQVSGSNNTDDDICSPKNTDRVCNVLDMSLYVFTTFCSYVSC